jgi:PHP family Zn ribbon phosphoesterase
MISRSRIVAGEQQGDDMRAVAASLGPKRAPLEPYQTRACDRCGQHTLFVLDDPGSGSYSCIKCGRYAVTDE